MNFRRCRAFALNYQAESMNAPTVAAIGSDRLAQAMVRQAKRYGIPVIVSDRIVKSINDCEIDQEVPEEMYLDIANIFAKYQIE